jgi:hypothetical protein
MGGMDGDEISSGRVFSITHSSERCRTALAIHFWQRGESSTRTIARLGHCSQKTGGCLGLSLCLFFILPPPEKTPFSVKNTAKTLPAGSKKPSKSKEKTGDNDCYALRLQFDGKMQLISNFCRFFTGASRTKKSSGSVLLDAV